MKVWLVLFFISSASLASGLQGTWQGPCYPTSQGYLQDEMKFDGTSFEVVTLHSSSDKCDSPNIRIESSGSFVEIDTDAGSIIPINLTPGSTYFTPLTSAIALSLNIDGLCGIRNWKANQQREVSGKKCDNQTIPQIGQIDYNIYSEASGTLYFGNETAQKDGHTPESRPTDLDTGEPYQPVTR